MDFRLQMFATLGHVVTYGQCLLKLPLKVPNKPRHVHLGQTM